MFLNALLEALWVVNTTAESYLNRTDASAPKATTSTATAGAAYLTVCDTPILFWVSGHKVDVVVLVRPPHSIKYKQLNAIIDCGGCQGQRLFLNMESI